MLQPDNSAAGRDRYRLCPIIGSQLRHDVLEMHLDRFFCDEQPLGDVTVPVPRGDVLQITANDISLKPRPNLNPGVPLELFGSGFPGGKAFNKLAFSQPAAGLQGNFGRNVLRAFNAAQADIGQQRTFRLTERTGLRFRGEFFNILNHPSFGPPMNSLTSALFGRATQTLANSLGTGGGQNGGFNPLYQIGGPRSIQLALKLQF